MVFTNSGKNKIRDLLSADVNHGLLGTDNTVPVPSQTALGTSVASTELTTTAGVADKQINIDYSLSAGTGNGENFTEFGLFNVDDVMFSRHIFAELTKESTEQWQISVSYRIL